MSKRVKANRRKIVTRRARKDYFAEWRALRGKLNPLTYPLAASPNEVAIINRIVK